MSAQRKGIKKENNMCLTHPEILNTELYGLPEAAIVGNCKACGSVIYDYEFSTCEMCEKEVHRGCQVICVCEANGCKGCMLEDEETSEYFCDTASTRKLEESECYYKR